jgi:hypothetical protein
MVHLNSFAQRTRSDGRMQIAYIVFEVPSNLLLKKMTPRLWQSRIIASWGIVLACHAAIQNKNSYYALRFLLGMVSDSYWKASNSTTVLTSIRWKQDSFLALLRNCAVGTAVMRWASRSCTLYQSVQVRNIPCVITAHTNFFTLGGCLVSRTAPAWWAHSVLTEFHT